VLQRIHSLRLRFLVGLAAVALLAAPGRYGRAEGPTADRQQQIAELEKQLGELQKKLAELKAAPATSEKRPLRMEDAQSWRGVAGATLSHDGQWFAYRVGPVEGDAEVVVRQTRGDKEYKFPAGEGRFGQITFSDDGKWLAFSVPPRRTTPTPPTTPPAVRPAAATAKVTLVNLADGAKVEFEGIRRFAFAGAAANCLALHKSPAPAGGTTTLGTGQPSGPAAAAPERSSGADLILRDLPSGNELTLGNVSEFAFDKKGEWLALVIDAQGQIGNGVQLRNMKTAALQQLDSGKASYQGLAWTEKGDGLTVLKGVEDKAFKGKLYSVLGFTDLAAAAPHKIIYDPKSDKTFPAGMTVSPNRTPSFSDDLAALFFGIHEVKKVDEKLAAKDGPPKDDAPKDAPGRGTRPGPGRSGGADGRAAEKPDLVIWHWNDERLQSQQQVQAGGDQSFNYLCTYRVKEGKFLRLADDPLRQVTVAPKQRWAIGTDDRSYRRQGSLDGKRFQDLFVIDLETGQRRPALSHNRWSFGPSPDGTHLLYYEDGHFLTYDLASGQSHRITEGAPLSFVDVEDDHNIDRPPTRPIGWSKDGSAVLLSDYWDVWKFPVHGGPAVNLTGDGKRDGIRYRFRIALDPEEKGIDLSAPQYFGCFGERTKKSGFARLEPGGGLTRLCFDDAEIGSLTKARNSDVFLYVRGTEKEYPEYYLTDATFKEGRKLTNTNPQQEKFHWTSGSMLLDYTSAKGDNLQAALLLPANYEKGKSYPTIVYIYERLSDRLHGYVPPTANGFSPAIYTSNGYAVLMPDIRYRVNDPGRSAVWCVLPALEAAVASGVVDRGRVGLHGHSWGGYQTAFLITQSDAFKAAVAGAPLTDLVSMYSSIYWNTGSANQPIFESSQGRFTAGYWEDPDAYIRNSPVYHARNVKTPLLLLHNDKDGAVDWTQGIEYFNTLRRLDKPVVMLQYKGENHGLAKPANQKDYTVRMREFFDHHLLGKDAPAWLKEGVPHLKMDDHLTERSKGP
jgi:dipeptidyl aminopeptidase/acylaminoacyl peptidase